MAGQFVEHNLGPGSAAGPGGRRRGIAEYERAKIAERYRRGKLFRSRGGEILAWPTPYGYRRHPRDTGGAARLTVFEPEAVVVRPPRGRTV